jgi:ABC-type polysaccharide transport system permease subunit
MRVVKTGIGGESDSVAYPRVRAGRIRRARLAQARLGYLFLLPTLAAVIVFQYYPALSAIYHAFTQWDGIGPPTFVGFAQFQAFFSDPAFGQAVINILKLTGFGMLVAVTVPLGVARLILGVPSAPAVLAAPPVRPALHGADRGEHPVVAVYLQQ